MDGTVAIAVTALTKEYRLNWRGGRLRALHGVTWSLPRGEIGGLLGPNGCGKSTSLKIILGLTRPTSGSCRVGGGDTGERATRRRIGYLPQGAQFQGFLTGEEVVRLHARLAGVPAKQREERVGAVLDWVGLGPAVRRPVGTYSTGMLRRVGLAQALVHDPDVVVLDEPMAGLDPRGIVELMTLLRDLRTRGKTVLLTSHLLPQVQQLCDRVVLLDRGRVVASGPVAELVGAAPRTALVVDPLPATALPDMQAWLAAQGSRLHRMEPVGISLDEVYLERTRVPGGEPPGGAR